MAGRFVMPMEDDEGLRTASKHFRRGFNVRETSVPDNDIPDRKAMACFVHYLLDLPNLDPDRISDICAGITEPDAGAQAIRATGMISTNIDYANRASRLMNRRQLTELVWNVRSLSKKLGGINLKLDIRNILVVTKPQDESLVTLTWKVARSLLTGPHRTKTIVYVEARLGNHPLFDLDELYAQEPTARDRLKFWHSEFIHSSPHQIDFVVTLGGDGTVLHTSCLFQGVVPPVLSFSLGSLGFLTKFGFNQYESTLHKVFNDGVIVSLRLRFECTVMRSKPLLEEDQKGEDPRKLKDELIGKKKKCSTHEASEVHQILNDVVVDRGPNPSK
ncbi:hypothetical protein KEM54_005839 [Ascosphaera aggregata]|nr:hypothetical protein KEM54_005839 [Ascosphaera aggregata]